MAQFIKYIKNDKIVHLLNVDAISDILPYGNNGVKVYMRDDGSGYIVFNVPIEKISSALATNDPILQFTDSE